MITRVALIAIVALASFLRLYHLGHDSFWYDEWWTWYASSSVGLEPLIERLLSDYHPPGYQALIFWVRKLLGDAEWALRLPSALAGIAAVALSFRLGRRLYDEGTGLIAALLMTVLWCPISISQDARSYSLLVFFVMLCMDAWLGVAGALSQKRVIPARDVALFVPASIAAGYLHYYGALSLGLLAAASASLALSQRYGLGRTLALFVPFAIAFLPWTATLLRHLRMGEFWIEQPGTPFRAFAGFAFYALGESTLVIGVGLTLAGASLLLGWLQRSRGLQTACPWRKADALVLGWLLLPFSVAYLESIASVPTLTPKNLLVSLPAIVLVLARLLRNLAPSPSAAGSRFAALGRAAPIAATGALALAALVNLLGEWRYYTEPQKNPFRAAALAVTERIEAEPQPFVLGYQPAHVAPYDYYFARIGSQLRVDRAFETVEELEAVLSSLRSRDTTSSGRSLLLLYSMGWWNQQTLDTVTKVDPAFVEALEQRGYELVEWVGHDAFRRAPEYFQVGYMLFLDGFARARPRIVEQRLRRHGEQLQRAQRAVLRDLSNTFDEGTRWDAPGVRVIDESGILVSLAVLRRAPRLELSLDHNDVYEIRYLRSGEEIVRDEIRPTGGPGLAVMRIAVPAAVMEQGCDTLWLRPVSGDGAYSLGHVRLLWTPDDAGLP